MIYILYTLLGAAIVAIAQTAGKLALRDLHPVKVCAFRFGLGAPVCYLLGVAQTHNWNPGLTMHQYLIIALIGVGAWGIGAVIFFWAMKMDSMHRVGTISNSLSVWVVLISVLFLGEPFFPAMIPALILLVAGAALLSPQTEGSKRWAPAIPIGILISVIWALSIVMTKIAVHGVPYPTFVAIKMAGATLFLMVLYPFTPTRVTKHGFIYGLISALTLVVGDTLLMAGVDGLPASIFSPLYSTTIPFGFLFSVAIIKEKPVRRNWLGMALIFAAAAICGYYRPK
ncbi:MAG: DMT family transporter [bacterium]